MMTKITLHTLETTRVDRERKEARFVETSEPPYNVSVEWYIDEPSTSVIMRGDAGHFFNGSHVAMPDGLIVGILQSKGYTVTPPPDPPEAKG